MGRRRGFGAHGGQNSTSCDIGLRKSKSFSPPGELDNRILRGYCGVKEFGNPGPFHIKSKAHAEEEEMSEDERRRSKLPGDIVEDRIVLGNVPWQFGPSLSVLGHIFLLGMGLGPNMKWAGVAKFFGPTIAPQNPAVRLLGRGGGF